MKRKYFSVDEVSDFFKKKDMVFCFDQLRRCVLEGIIHPLVYIDSRPVYAAQLRGKEAVAIGFCYLSAYLDMGDEIIVVLDKLSNSQSVQIEKPINKDWLSNVKVFGWRIDSQLFDEVPVGHVDLKPFTGIDPIQFFFCLQNNPICLQIKNLIISSQDLESLYREYEDKLTSKFQGKGKKERVHKLKLLIQKIYQNSNNKTAEAIWRKIKLLDLIWIESIDPWPHGRNEAKIKWYTGDKGEKPFSQGAFVNYITKLNTGAIKFAEETYDDLYDDNHHDGNY